MWRQNPIREIPDSDQSISEEEELDDICAENVVSLNPSAGNKEELPLPVRLDFLRGGASKQSLDRNGSNSSFEKPTGAPLEDDVELPDFEEVDLSCPSGEVVANSSDEEMTFEDEGYTVLSKYVIESGTKDKELRKNSPYSIRSEQVGNINEESEALLGVKESASCSASHDAFSKANRCGDGIRSKAMPRFSQQLLSHKHEPSVISNCDNSVSIKIPRLPQTMDAVHSGISEHSIGSYLENDDGMGKHSETEPAEAEGLALGFNPHSMAELVDNLQDKAYLYLPHHSRRRGKKVKYFPIRSRSLFQDRIINGENSPEPMDSGSSSDNEEIDQNMKNAFPEKKMLTMADRFQEALGASCVTDEGTHVAALKSFGGGIFGNLQRIMQKEKERDMDFLRKSHTGASSNSGGLSSVDVKIISRYLDGKLTVCCCLFCKCTEEFLLSDNLKGMVCGSQERTIIFSSRVCDNIDLEVGNMIRIHPPWKEVQVGSDNIILCTYFSGIPYPV